MSRLASYDFRGLGRMLRARLEADGRGWRACAAEIGVTHPDLSRVCAGQPVSAPKVIAVCDWVGLPIRAFYEAPDRGAAGHADSQMFHGNSTETEEGPHAG